VSSVQQLRLKYQISVRFLPITPTHYECAITGYDDTFGYTAGWTGLSSNSYLYTNFKWIVDYLLKGSSFKYSGRIGCSTGTFTFPALLTSSQTSGVTAYYVAIEAYSAGTHYRILYYTFTTLQIVQLNKTLYMGSNNNTSFYLQPYWAAVFDDAIDKPDTHNLQFRVKISWGRET